MLQFDFFLDQKKYESASIVLRAPWTDLDNFWCFGKFKLSTFHFTTFFEVGVKSLGRTSGLPSIGRDFLTIFDIFWFRHHRTGPRVSKTLAMHPYLICCEICDHSDPHSMIFPSFSIFWPSIWNGQNHCDAFWTNRALEPSPHPRKHDSGT